MSDGRRPPEHAEAHDHRHSHSHAHGRDAGTRALSVTLGANAVLLVAQVAVGVLAGSLAVIADAVHQGTDVAALGLALGARWLAGRPARGSFTYGYRPAEVVAAAVNAALLGVASVWVLWEAVQRMGEPADIEGWWVVAIGLVGLAVNGGSAVLLARRSGDSLNLRAAGWHLATDAAGSAAVVVVGAVALGGDGSLAGGLDTAASIGIAVLALVAAVQLARRAGRGLLQAAPPGFEPAAVEAAVLAHPEVDAVHHLHLWTIGDGEVAMSGHVVVGEDLTLHEAREVIDELDTTLATMGVSHATLQIECHPCD